MTLDLGLLCEILGEPAAPYRERHVIAKLEEILKRHAVPHFVDPVGNVVVGAGSKAEYLKLIRKQSPEPVRVAIAHMDHPGFHGVSWLDDDRFEFRWFGGSATKELEGRKVWLADRAGWLGHGVMESAELAPHGRAIARGVIRVTEKTRAAPKVESVFGSFGFRAPCWQEGDLMYAKAADDLVGVYAIVHAAIENHGKPPKGKKKKKSPAPFLGLLTRAEEVGFIGTLGHLELGWWKQARRELVCLSLETSRALPQAEIGKGPIVRLGDRMNVFHASYTRLFTDLAAKTLPDGYQRRVMDGGACEGSAAISYGIPTIAISVPLGNYHNQSLEGGPDAGPLHSSAPEYVNLGDVQGMLGLIEALLQPNLPWKKPFEAQVKNFRTSYRKARKLLVDGLKI